MISVTVTVTDPLPAEVAFVPGSANLGGMYDESARTVSWVDIAVPPESTVDLSFAVTAAISVDFPTPVVNTALIATEIVSFERSATVLLLPDAPHIAFLQGSFKTASQYALAHGDTITYTIRLHNSSVLTASTTVTDPIPAELEYIVDSASEGAVYDEENRTLVWSGLSVPPSSHLSLSFAVTAAVTVTEPTVVWNFATISNGISSFERRIPVVLFPDFVLGDHIPPMVHSLTIDEQDVLTSPTVTLHISATDNVSVEWMFLREWQLATDPFPHWEEVQSSGWVPFQAEHPWTLGSESGTHFVGVWVADSSENRSHLDRRSLDFASLVQPGSQVAEGGSVPYLVYYDQGITVTATLTPTEGDADLYVWYPDNHLDPDESSAEPGSAVEEVTFVTPSPGTYLFLVFGRTEATYDLSITPPGGPRAWAVGDDDGGDGKTALAPGRFQILSADSLAGADSPTSPLAQSGVDPLGAAEVPSGLHVNFLSLVFR